MYQPGFSMTLRRMTLGVRRVVVAHADAGLVDDVLAGDGLEVGQRLVFRPARRRQRQVGRQADGGGTVWSISWSRLAAPMSASIWLISAAQGPMWRPMNSSCCSGQKRVGGHVGIRSRMELRIGIP